jgi:Zn-finger in ubiquitin-hydrolases and other protein
VRDPAQAVLVARMPRPTTSDVPTCPHVRQIRSVVPRTPQGCEECLRIGSGWVHLRLCLTCGHVGCCDSSPGRHARRHAYLTGHAIVQSFQPGEDWRWCFFDETYV